MAETDLADWLTVDDTAARIGCSKRTVERLGRARKLEQRLRRQEGTPPVAVYNPEDVDRIASERHRAPTPFVLPAASTPTNGNGHGAPTLNPHWIQGGSNLPVGDDPIRQLFAAALRAVLSPPSPPSPPSVAERAAYVPRAEALALAGVSADELRRAVQAGEVKVRGRRYRRKDLEAL